MNPWHHTCPHKWLRTQSSTHYSSHLIYPLTMRVIGTPQMLSQAVSSIFPCSPLPFGTWWIPSLSIPWCCLPHSSSDCLVFFSLSLCLARWFWPHHCSLCLFMMVRRSLCGLIACWILAQTSLLVTWSLYEMHSILQKHLISMACILLWSSSMRVHDSQAYRKMDLTRECISRILELREILLTL